MVFVVVNGGCCGLQQYSQPVGTTQHGGRAFSRRWRTAAAALPNRSYSYVVEYLRTRLQYSCDAFFTSLQEF